MALLSLPVTKSFLRLPALLCLAALLSQCATKDKAADSDDDKEKPKRDPVAVGIVEFVNPEQKFVLIKMQSRMPMPPGQALTALDATGALSELAVSPERKGTHLTADIKSGLPRAGNLVIYRPDEAKPGDLVPLSPMPQATHGDAQVEWRDGQPPPIVEPGVPPSMPPAGDMPIIPLEPLPEEPPVSAAP